MTSSLEKKFDNLINEDLNSIIEDLIENKGQSRVIYKRSRIATLIADGFKNFTIFLEQLKNIPFVGGIVQLLALLPRTVSILADPKKSFTEKMISVSIISSLIILSIMAFFLKTIGALILGVVIGSVMSFIDLMLVSKTTKKKLQTSSVYHDKKAFLELIKNRIRFKDKYFNEQAEIRCLELEHQSELAPLNSEAQNDLRYLNSILPKDWIENKSKHPLKQLYEQRRLALLELGKQFEDITSKPYDENTSLNFDEIIKIDKQISKYTKPLDQLKLENAFANKRIFITYANLAIALTSTAVSIIALLAGMSVLVAPPIFLPLMVVVGVSLAVLGLSRWLVSLDFEKKKTAFTLYKEKNTKRLLLQEAFSMLLNQQEALVEEKSDNEGNVSVDAKSLENLKQTQSNSCLYSNSSQLIFKHNNGESAHGQKDSDNTNELKPSL